MQLRGKAVEPRNMNEVVPSFCGSRKIRSQLAIAAGAEPGGQLEDRQIARRCGTKNIWKWQALKHTGL